MIRRAVGRFGEDDARNDSREGERTQKPIPPLPIVFQAPFATAHSLRQVAAHHQCVQFLAAGFAIIAFAASGDGKAGAFIETPRRLIIFLDFEKHGPHAAPGEVA